MTVREWFRGMRTGDDAILLFAQLENVLNGREVGLIEYRQCIYIVDRAVYERWQRQQQLRWRYTSGILG